MSGMAAVQGDEAVNQPVSRAAGDEDDYDNDGERDDGTADGQPRHERSVVTRA
jgi:hypothetical protein